jgi:hypothetical protein
MGLLDPQLSVHFTPQLLHTDKDRRVREEGDGGKREREKSSRHSTVVKDLPGCPSEEIHHLNL